MDPDPIFVIDLQDKKIFFFCYILLKLHLHHFSKIKSNREVGNKTVGMKVFLTISA